MALVVLLEPSRPLGDRCLLLRYQPAVVAAAAADRTASSRLLDVSEHERLVGRAEPLGEIRTAEEQIARGEARA
ncbi:MAG: hypothetical protein WD737_01910 [Gemmatimonadota bacterium]